MDLDALEARVELLEAEVDVLRSQAADLREQVIRPDNTGSWVRLTAYGPGVSWAKRWYGWRLRWLPPLKVRW